MVLIQRVLEPAGVSSSALDLRETIRNFVDDMASFGLESDTGEAGVFDDVDCTDQHLRSSKRRVMLMPSRDLLLTHRAIAL